MNVIEGGGEGKRFDRMISVELTHGLNCFNHTMIIAALDGKACSMSDVCSALMVWIHNQMALGVPVYVGEPLTAEQFKSQMKRTEAEKTLKPVTNPEPENKSDEP
jgi:hypothetical protein